MTKPLISLAALFALTSPALAQDAPAAPSPNQVVAEAPVEEWLDIPAEDLVVMTLAPAAMDARIASRSCASWCTAGSAAPRPGSSDTRPVVHGKEGLTYFWRGRKQRRQGRW